MSYRGNTSKLVDEVLRFAAFSGVVAAVLVAPNIIQALDKPLRALDKSLNRRERAREAQRIVYYMKSQGYLAGEYEHGLQLTPKAIRRFQAVQLNDLSVQPLGRWDHFWRLVLYDIPEDMKGARNGFHTRLRQIGCFQLQRSVWITPFPCRDLVETFAAHYGTDKYVTYFEARNLDNELVMLRYFSKKYPATKF